MLGSESAPNRGLPDKPEVNPSLDGGLYVTVCNASKSISHRIDGATVRVESFVPLTGDLNGWQFCDGWYQNGKEGVPDVAVALPLIWISRPYLRQALGLGQMFRLL
jgi:hypothetical protein